MVLSDYGKAFIKSWEQCRLTAYRDGGGVWTIGWGHTGAVKQGMTCSKGEADMWFDLDAMDVEAAVRRMLRRAVTQNQFDALCSLAFNIGHEALAKSTLIRLLNQGNPVGAANEFPRWCHDNGQVVPGLVRRRAAEKALFESEV